MSPDSKVHEAKMGPIWGRQDQVHKAVNKRNSFQLTQQAASLTNVISMTSMSVKQHEKLHRHHQTSERTARHYYGTYLLIIISHDLRITQLTICHGHNLEVGNRKEIILGKLTLHKYISI